MKFEKVEFQPLLFSVNKPSRYIDHEINAVHKMPSTDTVNFVLAFPDVYEVGMSHLGLKILYTILNEQPDAMADRVYAPWPDFGEQLQDAGLPLFGVESKIPVADFDVLGFTLQSELNFTNILYILELAGIPLVSTERSDDHPIVIAGGPCASNPAVLSPFIDAFLIGEGEEAILEIKDAIRDHDTRTDKLQALSRIQGMYVPAIVEQDSVPAESLPGMNVETTDPGVSSELLPSASIQLPVTSYQLPSATHIRKYAGFSAYQMTHENQLIPWQHATHDRYVAEIMRGCTRGCRFCHAGFFYRPSRERNPQEIIDHILEEVRVSGWEEAALVSLSSSDYTCIRPLLLALHQRLKDNGATISLPSLRVDSLDAELVKLINAVGKAGLTVAPEAGSQRLRDIINKNITEEEILQGVHIALENGWQLMKLYFMIGLPGEEEEDIYAIIELVEKIISISRKKLQINVSISPFVPKPFTPFQWSAMLSREKLLQRALMVKHALSRYKFVKVKYHQIESSMLEAVLCRGNADTGKWMQEAFRLGAKFDGWHEYFDFSIWEQAGKNIGYDWHKVLEAIPVEKRLPWDHINLGVSKDYLLREWELSRTGIRSGDCKTEGCLDCGVCHDNIQMDVLSSAFLPYGKGGCHEVTGELKATHSQLLPSAPDSPNVAKDSNPSESLTQLAVTSYLSPSASSYRVFYAKMDDLRFISHLDLMRMIFRLVRRNQLPVVYTQGFNPHPKISLGPPLPLGVEGEREFFDMTLSVQIPVAELSERLKSNFADAIQFRDLEELVKADRINWESEGVETVEIIPGKALYKRFEDGATNFSQIATMQITRIRKEKTTVSDLKEIVLSMQWMGEYLLIEKKLKGAGIYDVLEHVFGLERTQAYGLRIIRKRLTAESL